MTSLPTTTPPTRARLPTAAEMDEMCGRAFLEVFRELREERDRVRVIAGPCVPSFDGPVARVVELPDGSGRIEVWKRGVGWIEGSITPDKFIAGACRPVLEKDARRLGCRLEDFGRHWTEEPATPRDRAKIVGLLKERAWDLAARQGRLGRA